MIKKDVKLFSVMSVCLIFSFIFFISPFFIDGTFDYGGFKQEVLALDRGDSNFGSKSLYVTPGIDFYTDKDANIDQIGLQLEGIFNNIESLGFNNLILNVDMDGKVIHSSNIFDTTNVDALSMIINKAKERRIGVYSILNVYGNNLKSGEVLDSYLSSDKLSIISDYFNEFAKTYNVDGILIGNYSVKDTNENYMLYRKSGGGTDYKEWLKDTNSYFIRNITDGLRNAGVKEIGLYTSSVWANLESDPLGSNTKAAYQSLVNGYSDTKLFVENGYVDYVMVNVDTSLYDETVPFIEVVQWWSNVVSGVDKSYYVIHDVNKLGTDEQGWDSLDQVIRQISVSSRTKNYKGSVFRGYQKLIENNKQSTTALLKFYNGEYKEENLFKDINITSPNSTDFETFEETVRFAGSYDPQFDVFINGEKIVPTSDGEFLMDYPLNFGVNKFEVEHKGQIKLYNVTRQMKIIQSVSPTGEFTVENGSIIELEVIARKGAQITANLGAILTTLEEFEGGDNVSPDSLYIIYKGSLKIENVDTKDGKLGNITFNGKYDDFSEEKIGASVILDMTKYSLTGPVLQVKSDYADIYSSKNITSYANPRMYTIPKGTMDYYLKTSNINGQDYYITKSGRALKASDSVLTDITNNGNNSINSLKVVNDASATSIVISQSWNVPFEISFNNLYSSNQINSFNSNTVTLVFDYTTTVFGDDISAISSSLLFSGAKLEKTMTGDIPQYSLTLTLRNAGVYYGAQSYYDDNGNLVIKFNNPVKSLRGLRVVIDPGHGYNESGSIGKYNAGGYTNIVYENNLNWNMANALKSKLEANGAIVKMLDTKNDPKYYGLEGLYNRVKDAQSFGPHLFLSLHHNSSSTSTATGVETYYNTPFSQPMAKSIVNSIGEYYNRTLYNDGLNRNRGEKFSEFLVTRFKTAVSVIIEYGFMSNSKELEKLSNPNYVNGLAQATVDGIYNYVSKTK